MMLNFKNSENDKIKTRVIFNTTFVKLIID